MKIIVMSFFVTNDDTNFTVLHQNMQCLNNKVLVLESALCDCRCQLLLVTEHWLREMQLREYQITNFELCSSFCRSQLGHGGVAIFKNNDFKVKCVKLDISEYCVEGIFECAAVRIECYKCVIVVIYRPPVGHFNEFLNVFEGLLLHLSSFNGTIIIGGDFNIDFQRPGSNLTFLKDILHCCNLSYVFDEPTRVTSYSSTCIDNFFVSKCADYAGSVVNLGISDHYSQLLKVSLGGAFVNGNVSKSFLKRNINGFNTQTFVNYLRQEDWQIVRAQACPNKAFDKFADVLFYYFDISFPLQRFNCSKNRKSSTYKLSPFLIQLKNRVILYSELAKHDRRFSELSKYLNRRYREQLKLARIQYNDEKINESANKSKAVWSLVNNLQNRSVRNKIEITQGNVVLSDETIANNFNFSFAKAGCSSNAGALDVSFLNQNVQFSEKTFFMQPVCTLDIQRYINGLKNSHACGVDGISNNLLKQCGSMLLEIIEFLINLCILNGIFPDKLKLASVRPVYKKGDNNDYSNYRAISLLTSISKIFELVIKDQLNGFLVKNNILSPRQHGFTKNKSTETALCEFHKKITDALDKKLSVLGLFIDFSRAFDCVHHELLLAKLYRYGIRGVPYSFLKSYLCDRFQFVEVNGVKSSKIPITQGVPQGSILGPLLYLIFSNDIITYLSKTNVHVVCYADDTNILVIDKDFHELKCIAESVYKQIVIWSEKNFLYLNKDKTVALKFTISPQITDNPLTLFENSTNIIKCSKSTKMLGINWDYKLNWNCHIEVLCGRLRSACYGLNFLSNHCSTSTLLAVYYADFHSRMRYGILNWGTGAQAVRVFRLQKYAIRILTNLKRSDTCRNAFKQLKVLTLYDVYIMECCLFVFKNREMFSLGQGQIYYNFRRQDLLTPGQHRTTLYQKTFYFNCCKYYNALPRNMKDAPNLNSFKQNLKRFLLQKTCYTLNDFDIV